MGSESSLRASVRIAHGRAHQATLERAHPWRLKGWVAAATSFLPNFCSRNILACVWTREQETEDVAKLDSESHVHTGRNVFPVCIQSIQVPSKHPSPPWLECVLISILGASIQQALDGSRVAGWSLLFMATKWHWNVPIGEQRASEEGPLHLWSVWVGVRPREIFVRLPLPDYLHVRPACIHGERT